MVKKEAWSVGGLWGLLLTLGLKAAGIYLTVTSLTSDGGIESGSEAGIISGLILIILSLICWSGHIVLEPNESLVLLFFGQYSGNLEKSGYWFTIPLVTRQKVSLRVTNFNTKQLKVNDVNGNPIEIAAVVVFRVVDSAKAKLDVENYMQFVETQSETSLRHVASSYPYDDFEGDGISLRGNADEIAKLLSTELHQRLSGIAGVEVMEARLTHLAYSSEIAGMMLQRQQAAAIVAARQTIVEGAVGMVRLALDKLEADGIVSLDQKRRAVMVNNLMVAIVSERAAQPVINAGKVD